MVFVEAPRRRAVARMLMPSTRHPMICARFSVLSRFILIIMLDAMTLIKRHSAHTFRHHDVYSRSE